MRRARAADMLRPTTVNWSSATDMAETQSLSLATIENSRYSRARSDATHFYFLNNRLTLQNLAIKTSRYSPAYVRSVIRNLVLAAGVFAALGMGGLWTVLEQSQFAEAKTGTIEIQQGLPGIHLFGFPRLIWSLPFSAEAFKPEHDLVTRGSVTAFLGNDLVARLLNDLTPVASARLAVWQGEA